MAHTRLTEANDRVTFATTGTEKENSIRKKRKLVTSRRKKTLYMQRILGPN